jgi:hypothetical protein
MKMPTTYLVTPLKKNSLVNEQIFKKGKHTFTVITTWEKVVLITESVPKNKTVDGKKVTILKEFKFKENRFDYKKKLVLPEDLSENEIKGLKKLFKSDDLYGWKLDESGWKSYKDSYTLFGEYESRHVPVHQLTLFSSEQELQILTLTKEQVTEFSKNGLPQSLLYELSDSTEVCAPVFDERTSLSIDDEELPDFYEKFKIKYDDALKEANFPKLSKSKKVKSADLKYALVQESWIKRSWYELTIYEDFNFSKLQIYISRDDIFGSDSYVETFSLNYDELDFEFRENYGANSSETYIVDSNGKQTGFEIIDDEEDNEDEDE